MAWWTVPSRGRRPVRPGPSRAWLGGSRPRRPAHGPTSLLAAPTSWAAAPRWLCSLGSGAIWYLRQVEVNAADRRRELFERVIAAGAALEANTRRLNDAREQLEAVQAEARAGRTTRQALHESAFARLQARLDTLPVIEQAKGIVMAQTGCTAEEAFDLLRQASQRRNVKIRDLASEIVGRTAARKRAS